jgi:hypothetical protein
MVYLSSLPKEPKMETHLYQQEVGMVQLVCEDQLEAQYIPAQQRGHQQEGLALNVMA